MIRIKIARNRDGFITGFTAEGHAGYAECGSDIVCAAVSVTAYTAVGALENLAGLKGIYTEKDGYMSCNIPEEMPEEVKQTVKIIMETTVIGFKQIEYSYGSYVRVFDKEV